jgi:arylsulfatase A-like enzyme
MLLSGRSLFHIPSPMAQQTEPNFPKSLGQAGYFTYHDGKKGNTPQQIQKDFHHNHYANDNKERTSGYPGQEITDAAVEFLRGYKKDRPFFLYLAFANPHDPRVVNKEYRDRYDEAKMPLPRNYRPFHPFYNGELLVRDE